MSTSIPCTCDPDGRLRRVEMEAITPYQGPLKTLHQDQYNKLKASMERYGFFAPLFLWAGHGAILDGHQRLHVLEREGWTVEGGIPVVEIEAADEKDAAEKLLLLSSTYGKIDPQGLYEFAELHAVDLREFVLPDLPDFDLDMFQAEYYGVNDDYLPGGKPSQIGPTRIVGKMIIPPRVWLENRQAIQQEIGDMCETFGIAIEWPK